MKTFPITANANHATVDRLQGYSITEDAVSPAAASVIVRKGSAVGQPVFYLTLAASETATFILPSSFSCEGGAYVEVVSGTIAGVLFGT